MACGLRCPSPLNLGAAGNYSSLKSLNPCSSSSPASPSPVRAQLQPFLFLLIQVDCCLNLGHGFGDDNELENRQACLSFIIS
jgi:hypothetical protein